MNTFLPLPSFRASAAVLDNKRTGKQRLECKQILLCLGVTVGEHKPGKRGWRNHPAVRMWAGYELQLSAYAILICRAWRARGFKDTLLVQFMGVYHELRKKAVSNPYPAWFGCPEFHASHRSNLLRKDPVYYSQFGWLEPNDLPYVWPAGALNVA